MLNRTAQIFGLFELDAAGTVMYSKIDAPPDGIGLPADLVGRNFFDEIAPFENDAEIHRRFYCFAKSSDAAEKFTFTYSGEQPPIEIKVMLTQVRQREYDERGKLIIVDIRKVSDQQFKRQH